jgi:hypothetical protein
MNSKRKQWDAARAFFAHQGKIANQTKIGAEEMREIGMTGLEIEKFQKTAHYMAAEFYSKLAELTDGTGGQTAMTAPDSQGKTPLQSEVGANGEGMAVHTDHASKDPFTPLQQTVMKKVQNLIDINEIEGPSGEGEGALLSSTDVISPAATTSNGAKDKVAREKSRREKVLDVLLNS